MSQYKDGWEVIIQEGFKAPKDAQPILCVWGCLVGVSLKQGNCLPKLCPYVWGCEKEVTMVFSMTMSLGWLYMRAPAQTRER